jgi:aspartyl-tRNA(Asn)/glutamyl-tRNA(Gln) amidotransferase subunit A
MLLSAMAGPDPRDPLTIDAPPENYLQACDGDIKGLRIVWSVDLGYATLDPEVRTIAEAAALRFADLGCEIEARDPGWLDPRTFHKIIAEIALAARLGDYAAEHPDWVEPTLIKMIENARTVSAIEHGRALLARSVFYDKARRFFETCDLLLTPQMPVSAWSAESAPTQEAQGTGRSHSWDDRLAFTVPFNLTGQPAASVPCGFTSEGLPVGLQIVGRWHADPTVLRAAACFEVMQPWATLKPPLE